MFVGGLGSPAVTAGRCASPQDIVAAITRSPRFVRVSLDKHIIPAFELVRSFCPSDKKAIHSIIACPTSISDPRMKPNVKFLLDFGLTASSIYRLLTSRPSIICTSDLKKALEEIKELGFQPSKYNFCVALLAKRAVTKSQWDAKFDVLKSWGCSEDDIFNAFRKQPNFMLRIEKRLIPRASVIKYLLSKGLMKKGSSLCTPFHATDEDFQRRYVKRFEEETSKLLKLNQGDC
ncbi:transcription termination factor family protein [Medicago truncatula]|uniref:Transcription termination factor family protein n=1 Tax=Medicago truncatula TaxID=3880 RepID=G7JKC9_MEDTR|nr:transcription termination factor family protein [Medicago truncatula]